MMKRCLQLLLLCENGVHLDVNERGKPHQNNKLIFLGYMTPHLIKVCGLFWVLKEMKKNERALIIIKG